LPGPKTLTRNSGRAMPKIILGVTGSIAAFKGAALASLLVKAGHDVHAVLTPNACEFVTPLTFQALTSNPVSVDMFAAAAGYDPSHVALARDAGLLVIAPASADILARMACGIADDMLSTTYLSVSCPVLAAPAMHSAMYVNPAVQENIKRLKARGMHFVGPEKGRLASGDTGPGRMSEPEKIAGEIEKLLS
jgi:phosphopantothenoylcysteine decarboxylase/phosphopantothenate--cysteine ligase